MIHMRLYGLQTMATFTFSFNLHSFSGVEQLSFTQKDAEAQQRWGPPTRTLASSCQVQCLFHRTSQWICRPFTKVPEMSWQPLRATSFLSICKDGGTCMHAQLVQACLTLQTLWTAAHQAPLSMGFFRQEYQSGLPCLPPRDFPYPGIDPVSLMSPALAVGFFTTSTPGSPRALKLASECFLPKRRASQCGWCSGPRPLCFGFTHKIRWEAGQRRGVGFHAWLAGTSSTSQPKLRRGWVLRDTYSWGPCELCKV